MSQAGRKIGGAALIVAAAVSLSACSMFRPGDHQAGQSRVEHDNGINTGGGGGGLFGGGGENRGGRTHMSVPQPLHLSSASMPAAV